MSSSPASCSRQGRAGQLGIASSRHRSPRCGRTVARKVSLVQLTRETCGADTPGTFVGYVRNHVPHPDEGYPHPAPDAYVPIFLVDAKPRFLDRGAGSTPERATWRRVTGTQSSRRCTVRGSQADDRVGFPHELGSSGYQGLRIDAIAKRARPARGLPGRARVTFSRRSSAPGPGARGAPAGGR